MQTYVVKITVMDHQLYNEQKVLVYSVDSAISENRNVINRVYLIGNVLKIRFA